MTILFFDTETTGLPVKHAALDDIRQPRIVQLAMIEASEDGEIISQNVRVYDCRIHKDEEFSIPQQSSEVHGITTDFSTQYGTPQDIAIKQFVGRVRACQHFVAHNADFDLKILSIAAARYGIQIPELDVTCTMESTRDILKIPPTQRMKDAGLTQYKSPRLEEAYQYFFNEGLSGAHDALVDTRACMRVYFELKKRGDVK